MTASDAAACRHRHLAAAHHRLPCQHLDTTPPQVHETASLTTPTAANSASGQGKTLTIPAMPTERVLVLHQRRSPDKILLRGLPLAHPHETAGRLEVLTKRTASYYFNNNHLRRQDRRGMTVRAGEAGAKATLLAACVPTRTWALPLPTHTTPLCMQNVKRRRQRRPHELNRRCLAV